MSKIKSTTLLLIGGISIVGLTGCEQLEQATNAAVEKAKESTVQIIDEAKQVNSIEDARQTANRAMQEAKQTAAGLLGQASQYLSAETQEQEPAEKAGSEPAPAL